MTANRADRLRDLLAVMHVPRDLTTAGLQQRFGNPDEVDPAVGQVRRAQWADVSRLVVLIAAEDRYWRVVPVSVEPTGEDQDSLIIDATRAGFGVEVTAWAGLTAAVPTGALGRLIDVWEPDVVEWCAASPGSRPPVPVGARVGRTVDRYDGSAAVRADISDDLDVLAAAPLVPVQTAAGVDLKAATVRVGIPAVMAALDLPQATVMKIAQGRHAVTETQAATLADLFGYTFADVVAATGGLPAGLAVELERPRWRTFWQAIARRLGISEAAARLSVGTGVAALSYRQSGSAAPDWQARVTQWLASNGYGTYGTAHDQ